MYEYQEELEERIEQLERKLRRAKLIWMFLAMLFLAAIGLGFMKSVASQRNAVQAQMKAVMAQKIAQDAAQRAQAMANLRRAEQALPESIEAQEKAEAAGDREAADRK